MTILLKHSAETNSSSFVIWSIWNLVYKSVLKPRLYWINCYFYASSLILTFRLYSQSLDIIRRVFNTSFLRARRCFLFVINALCVITIIIIITFKILSKHLYLNNTSRSSDLYHYRNLLIIWNDFIRSCNSHMHFETFFSIETLFSHIFSDFQLPDFWYAPDNYQTLFSKYRFLTKSEIFIW